MINFYEIILQNRNKESAPFWFSKKPKNMAYELVVPPVEPVIRLHLCAKN